MKTFITIMLALTLLACDPDDSGSSSEPKKPDPVSTCSITQFQDGNGTKQAIAAMKDLDVGQTRTLFYECNIVKKDYNSKAKLAGFDDKVIQVSKAEIDIPDKAEEKGSFTVKGLKVGQTSIKIELEKSNVLTQLALSVAYVVSRCQIMQFQDETGKTQAIVAGKGQDIEKGQTLKLFYDCVIAQKDYGKTAKLAVSDTTAIQPSPAEIKLPAQDKVTGSFTVKGLQEGKKTNIKIDLGESKELALTVTPTFVLDPSKVKIAEVDTTGITLSTRVKKLEVYKDKLYLLDSTGSGTLNPAKFYSFDGTTWTDLGTPEDASDSTKKIKGQHFDIAVHDGKLWLIGSNESSSYIFWNFDGTNWNRLGVANNMGKFGSLVSFDNSLYQIGGGSKQIFVYDGSQWNTKVAANIGRIDSVVFDGKVWMVGGTKHEGNTRIIRKDVANFDGTTYRKKVATLPLRTRGSWWAAVEVFPRGLLAIGGLDGPFFVSAVFWSRFGKNWTNITSITGQDQFKDINSGATVVWNGALYAANMKTQKVLKITYEE